MLTIKVVTEWCGGLDNPGPNISGPIRPAEHIFEAHSVYNDAGRIMIHGAQGQGLEGDDCTITYENILYDKPWRQTIYVMNNRGSTISSFMIGSYGGDIGCTHKMNPSVWHRPVTGVVGDESSHGEQMDVAPGGAAG